MGSRIAGAVGTAGRRGRKPLLFQVWPTSELGCGPTSLAADRSRQHHPFWRYLGSFRVGRSYGYRRRLFLFLAALSTCGFTVVVMPRDGTAQEDYSACNLAPLREALLKTDPLMTRNAFLDRLTKRSQACNATLQVVAADDEAPEVVRARAEGFALYLMARALRLSAPIEEMSDLPPAYWRLEAALLPLMYLDLGDGPAAATDGSTSGDGRYDVDIERCGSVCDLTVFNLWILRLVELSVGEFEAIIERRITDEAFWDSLLYTAAPEAAAVGRPRDALLRDLVSADGHCAASGVPASFRDYALGVSLVLTARADTREWWSVTSSLCAGDDLVEQAAGCEACGGARGLAAELRGDPDTAAEEYLSAAIDGFSVPAVRVLDLLSSSNNTEEEAQAIFRRIMPGLFHFPALDNDIRWLSDRAHLLSFLHDAIYVSRELAMNQ